MTRVAAVDCGTNSLRLLVADADADVLVDVVRELRVVRLGEGVDCTGRLAPEALHRTREALTAYARTCEQLGVERVRMVATSATRDAQNREQLAAMVQEVLGVAPDVLTGEQEAALSFAGATRELPGSVAPFLVVDVGGGSTELVLGAGAVEAARSVDVGCVRLTERHRFDDPPTPDQVAAADADLAAALDDVRTVVPLDRARTLVGVAGTVTTVVAHALRLPAYDAARIHLARVPSAELLRACDDLIALPREQRSALPFMHPGRVDVIAAGALVLRAVVAASGCDELVASEHDILDGVAWALA